MKQTIVPVAFLLLICACGQRSMAQQDTTHLDVGYLTLKKEFTQFISIKGSDLEKMPFTNLSDAISAWLYGAYTQPVTLQYVVDGNPVSDVNAYSVFDIEEVMLVQNAAALVNTADGQQELVIIRTRRGQGKGGITVNAQTGLVKAKEYGLTAPLQLYHNYYFTAWRNFDKISYGVSGNYLRDVFPIPSGYEDVKTPDNVQRWRLNGYFTWRPDSHNQVEIMVNYTPQQMAEELGGGGLGSVYLVDGHGTQHFILPRLSWYSELSPKWTNDFQATYIHSTENAYSNNYEVEEVPNDSLLEQYNGASNAARSYHLWIRDHLGFRATAGHWIIEPAINASYEHFNEQDAMENMQSTFPYVGGSLSLVATPNVYAGEFQLKGNMVVLTPALDISYKRVMDVQVGVLVDAGKQSANGSRDAFPFASLSFDLLRLANDTASSGLKVFGSYAQRAAPSPQGYLLLDLTTDAASGNSPTQSYSYYSLNSTTNYVVPSYPPSPVYWVWETGMRYTGWKDRLTIQYTFERRNFEKALLIASPGGSSYGNYSDVFPEWQSTIQHVDIRVKVLDAEGVHWLTGVNVTLLENKGQVTYSNLIYNGPKQDVGDDSPSPHSWTGGWVNRVQVKRFMAGFDLLYHFGESVQAQTYYGSLDTVKVNSVITPNIYIGYSWHLSGVRTLEFFAESRGLIRNSTNDLLDDRRYYTIGGKLSL